MTDIEKAKRIADIAFGEADFGTVVDAIHGAILAERKRCAAVARGTAIADFYGNPDQMHAAAVIASSIEAGQ